jgi:hypothetical protein
MVIMFIHGKGIHLFEAVEDFLEETGKVLSSLGAIFHATIANFLILTNHSLPRDCPSAQNVIKGIITLETVPPDKVPPAKVKVPDLIDLSLGIARIVSVIETAIQKGQNRLKTTTNKSLNHS